MRIFILILVLLSGQLHADSFDDLLNTVRQQTREELGESQARLNDFRQEKQQQEQLLKDAKSELANLIAASEALNAEMDDNEKKLAESEEALQRKVGDLGELFGAIRQVAGELDAEFGNSMVSVQFPERIDFLKQLAQSNELPDTNELEQLWYLMLQEMGETGKTRQFQAAVTRLDGSRSDENVVRIGAFGGVANSAFLTHDPETNSLAFLQKQPPVRYSRTAANYASSGGEDLVKITLDPTRGQLLSMLTLRPSLLERVQQGGIIGYIILGLGALGLLVAFLRYAWLLLVSAKISRQAKKLDKPSKKNALGRVALVYNAMKNATVQDREVALEEAMLKEVPAIERYNGFIKLLAAVAPLLGLLGTVIGMIITFQTITLFGTSDPKLMAGGISTALVTTVLGLSVAIPLLFAHTFLSARSRRIVEVIEQQSVGMIARHAA